MRAPWKRAAILALATCSVSVLPGCKSDVEKADESASNEIAASSSLSGDKAVTALTSAASKGSPLTKVQSNLALAQAEVQAAGEKLRGAYQSDGSLQGVWPQEAKIAGLLLEMERVGSQIASNNGNISGFQALNPTVAQQSFDQVASAAEKGDGGWFKAAEGGAPVPSLADVKKKQETLGSQIADLTKQRTEIAAKRATALQQAETFARQSDSTRGSASTAAYIQASNLRKEAGDDEVKMRDFDAQILPLQQQLDVANEQQKLIEGTLASVKDQVGKLQSGWQNVQKQLDQLKEFSTSLVSGGGSAAAAGGATSQPATSQPTASNLNQMAADLNEQVKSTADLRDQAVKLLNDALKHIGDAEQQASAALKAMPKPGPQVPERPAIQSLNEQLDPSEFKLRRAQVLGLLARVYAGQYVELAQRNAVARLLDTGLKQAGVESQAVAAMGNGGAPSPAVREAVDKASKAMNDASFSGYSEQATELEGVNASTPSDQEALAALKADMYYGWADTILTDVTGGGTGSGDLSQLRVAAGHLAKMTNQYAWSKLGELEGKADAAKGRLATAVSERKALSDNQNYKGLLPLVLPPELAEVATSQPAGQPGTETATSQPASPDATAAASQPASPGTASADNPEQAAARAAALAFADALAAGDADKAKSMVVQDRIEYQRFATYYMNFANFKKAAVAKFGDAAQDMPAVLPDLKERIQSATIAINGTTATFNNPGEGEPLKAQNVQGTWKMDFAPVNPNEAIKQLQMLNIVAPVYARAMIGLQNNTYKSADELRQALIKDIQTAVPGYQPPPPSAQPPAASQPAATAPAGQ